MGEIHVCWEWPLMSTPESFWPLISDTGRFNADSGVPPVVQLDQDRFVRRMSLRKFGVGVEWREEPFEWQAPSRFGVVRRYTSGPLREMRVLAELLDNPSRLRYRVWIRPVNWVGGVLARLQLFESGLRFGRTVRGYDRRLMTGQGAFAPKPAVTPPGRARLERARRELSAAGCDPSLIARLCRHVESAEAPDAYRMRPYELADAWRADRRELVELCLRAVRAGMLEAQWELLCPLCRGAKQRSGDLAGIGSRFHCESCNIDFEAEFDRSVELTVRPHPAIRAVHAETYCTGGPGNTPHIVLQRNLQAGETADVRPALGSGVYRFRFWGRPAGQLLRAGSGAASAVLDGEPGPEMAVSSLPELRLRNVTAESQTAILEHFAWSDRAVTAAEVTAMPLFGELFEGETVSMPLPAGVLTVLAGEWTGRTRLLRELGDQAALSVMLQTYEEAARIIETEGGTVAHHDGGRLLAVFQKPAAAVRAAKRLEEPPDCRLGWRAGVEQGPLLVLTVAGRLSYFGLTVETAFDLAANPGGSRTRLGDRVAADASVRTWLASVR